MRFVIVAISAILLCLSYGCADRSPLPSTPDGPADLEKSLKTIWAVSAGPNVDINDVVSDSVGNIFITGGSPSDCKSPPATMKFGTIEVPCIARSVVVAKLNPSGNFIWVTTSTRLPNDSGDTKARGIALDHQGNIVITGAYVGKLQFGNTTITQVGYKTKAYGYYGNWDIFVAKLDPTGKFRWAITAGSAAGHYSMAGIGYFIEVGEDIAVDKAGNIYVSGMFASTAKAPTAFFGPIRLKGGCCPPGIDWCTDLFIAKLNPYGEFLWVATNEKEQSPYEVTHAVMDSAGHSYLMGTFGRSMQLGSFLLKPGSSESNYFVAKVDSDGKFLWATSVDKGYCSGGDAYSIALDNEGNAIITGLLCGTAHFGDHALTSLPDSTPQKWGSGDVFVAKINPSGKFLWATSAGTTSQDSSAGVTVDSQGNIISTGHLRFFDGPGTTAHFGSMTFKLKGRTDIFVTKLDPQGRFLNAESRESRSEHFTIYPKSMATTGDGHSVIVGNFSGRAPFGDTTLSSKFWYDNKYPSGDLFVWKVDSSRF